MRACTLLTAVVGAVVFIQVSHAAHVIKDADEAHHVTTHLLGATGKRHNHGDVHEIRRTFHGMRKEHEVMYATATCTGCETKLHAMAI